MVITKDRISSPLEAGSSILESTQLPLQLTSALEYVSSRLARKRLHLSLIVIRKEVNILPHPSSPLSPDRAESPSHSVTTSPAKSLFNTASSTITKSLRNHSSNSSLSDAGSSSSVSSFRSRWVSSPTLMKERSLTPVSPSSPTSGSNSPSLPNPYGITLMHAATLSEKAEKTLRRIIDRAEKKFAIGSGWLSSQPLTNTISCPLTNDLIRRSLTQNEVIFSSEGLTLLSLDHIYTFKCQLHAYSRTLSHADLTSTVDELRRLVLSQHGKRITKGYLIRAYDWLGVSLAALVDVNEGYKVAYGGEARHGGIEVHNEERQSPPPLKTNFNASEIRRMAFDVDLATGTTPPPSKPNSDLTRPISLARKSIESMKDLASPSDYYRPKPISIIRVSESSKTTKIPSTDLFAEDRGPHMRGPLTPNRFEDITPVTKGEWCFLMVNESWKGRTAPVETC